jgi:hypothetical protein
MRLASLAQSKRPRVRERPASISSWEEAERMQVQGNIQEGGQSSESGGSTSNTHLVRSVIHLNLSM